jgi:ribose transport system permease protein
MGDFLSGRNLLAVLRCLWREQAMLFALVALVVALSVLTWDRQAVSGAAAGEWLGRQAASFTNPGGNVAIIGGPSPVDADLVKAARRQLEKREISVAVQVTGEPADALDALREAEKDGKSIDVIIASESAGNWPVVQNWAQRNPQQPILVLIPRPYYWPNFLKPVNLLNISNQIAVIAIIAIGMTMVIIIGGIDLSVGSQVALSAVICTLLMRQWGGEHASIVSVVGACLASIVACGILGAISGFLVTFGNVPSFIVTLAMMLLADGLAYNLSGGATIQDVPRSFSWLAGGDALGVPNSAVLMGALYVVAWLVMTRTVFGRHLYAVGGNPKAAWLCGIPIRRVTLAAFTICGLLAGLGGVLVASQLEAGNPNYGTKYELMVIAAVVVGGTSLAGGRGTMWGTFVGALILAVLSNGMNLIGLESKRQQIVVGLVILSAVLLDRSKAGRD